MSDTFKVLLIASLRDKMTVFWSILFPIILMLILGSIRSDLVYREQLLATVVAMGILFNGIYGLSFDILLNRNNGIFKILRITPFNTAKFIFIFSLSKIVLSLITAYFSLIAGILIYQFDYSIINIISLLPLFMAGILCFSFIGFSIGNIANVETQVSLIANLIAMPLLFLSNSFYTIPDDQNFLQLLAKINPFNFFVQSTQELLTGDIQKIGLTYLILGILCFTSFLFAVITFRWEVKHD